jgi:F420-dependent oxidoreductase-like protein
MIEVSLMLEGQNGLNWGHWQKTALLAERVGFVGLFRSDHFTNARPPDLDSLELWASLTWLASHTRRLEFGPLVTPFSFRHPVHTARMARDLDDLSGGRLILGVGAGWQEREHQKFGFDLLDRKGRFDRFEEAVQVVALLLQRDDPVDFQGRFYHLEQAQLLPRPGRPGGPPLLIGGKGPQRTLPLVAQYADEWNASFVTPESFAQLNRRLDQLLQERGRDPGQVRRSLMTGVIFGTSPAEVRRRLEQEDREEQQLREWGMLIGDPQQLRDRLGEYEAAGVQRIMLQWLDLEDLDRLEALAEAVLGR